MPKLSLPEKLEKISPSTYSGLLECPLRASLQSNWHQPPPIRSGPAAQLGTVVHKLLELAGGGHIGPCSVGQEWDHRLSAQEAKLGQSSETAWMVPLCETAFRFHEVKLLALHKARLMADEAPKAGEPTQTTTNLPTEVKLTTQDGKIGGRVDYLSETPEGAVIKDYKTGAIFEKNTEGEVNDPELKSDYKLQMQLYAGIYHENCGRWPASLQIIPLAGEPEAVQIVPEECLALLHQARSKLDEINALLSESNAEVLAKPAQETCKYCGFRPICTFYHQACGMSAAEGWPLDVASQVEAISPSQGGTLVRLANGTSILAASQLSNELASLMPGATVAFYNLKRLRSGALFAWRGSHVSIQLVPETPIATPSADQLQQDAIPPGGHL